MRTRWMSLWVSAGAALLLGLGGVAFANDNNQNNNNQGFQAQVANPPSVHQRRALSNDAARLLGDVDAARNAIARACLQSLGA